MIRSYTLVMIILLVQQAFSQNTVAVDDTIDLVPGFPKTVNLLANDIFPPGDSIRLTGGLSAGGGNVISTWHYQGLFTYLVPYRGVGNLIIGSYTLLNFTSSQSSTGHMVFRIRDKSFDTLQINDVQALFTVAGLHFILPFNINSQSNGYVVPKGSGKATIFSNSFWIGGLDKIDSLHIGAERVRSGNGPQIGTKPDFYAGPVMDSTSYSVYTDTTWNYVWNLKKSDLAYHKNHWNNPGYKPIYDILTWPGNGDTSLGQASKLAPFHDVNGDGTYNPFEGDCPVIRGDQALFFIFNDDRADHLETKGKKLKAEIHGLAYAYDMPGDSAFSKTVFLNYKVFNRSSETYHNTYLGTFTDLDIGYFKDDFVQCDVGRGSFIVYNGKAIDGSGQSYAYGAHPPAQSVTILAGPRMEPAGADRPRFDDFGHQRCDESINGAGFGDGIADNERLGLGKFSKFYYANTTGTPDFMDIPVTPGQFYNYMQAIWMDGTRMIYGGMGHTGYGGYGPEADFLFPGESDTLNWGCGCKPPSGPVNWTESTAMNKPHDISGIGSTGPFTFHPGDMHEFDIAFVWARDYTSADTLASVAKLRMMIDTVRKAYLTNKLPGGGSFLGIARQTGDVVPDWNMYPNPASSVVTLEFGEPLRDEVRIGIYHSSGKLMASSPCYKGSAKMKIDVSRYTPGFYLVRIAWNGAPITKKLVIIK